MSDLDGGYKNRSVRQYEQLKGLDILTKSIQTLGEAMKTCTINEDMLKSIGSGLTMQGNIQQTVQVLGEAMKAYTINEDMLKSIRSGLTAQGSVQQAVQALSETMKTLKLNKDVAKDSVPDKKVLIDMRYVEQEVDEAIRYIFEETNESTNFFERLEEILTHPKVEWVKNKVEGIITNLVSNAIWLLITMVFLSDLTNTNNILNNQVNQEITVNNTYIDIKGEGVVYIREDKDIKLPNIYELPVGIQFEVLNCEDEWTKVKFETDNGDIIGWALSSEIQNIKIQER